MGWLTILIALLPLLLQLLQKLFPPKSLESMNPHQRHLLALALGRMNKVRDASKAAGLDPDGKEVREAMAADDE